MNCQHGTTEGMYCHQCYLQHAFPKFPQTSNRMTFTCSKCKVETTTIDHRGWCNLCLMTEAKPIAPVEYHMTESEFRIVGKPEADRAHAYLAVWLKGLK